jgi:hypothetical protein
MGWVVNATPRPLYPRERPGTHCIGGWVVLKAGEENLASTGVRSPNRPARSELLYRLSYHGFFKKEVQKRQEGRRQEKSRGGGCPRVMVCGGTSAAEHICTHGLLETPVAAEALMERIQSAFQLQAFSHCTVPSFKCLRFAFPRDRIILQNFVCMQWRLCVCSGVSSV